MSNLGMYQWMTTTSKRVGGPVNLLLLVATTGAVMYKLGELGIKQCAKKICTEQELDQKVAGYEDKIYMVTSWGKINGGLVFDIGDQFKVLESDGDSVLIEKIGERNNPYFVSAKLLHVISNYRE